MQKEAKIYLLWILSHKEVEKQYLFLYFLMIDPKWFRKRIFKIEINLQLGGMIVIISITITVLVIVKLYIKYFPRVEIEVITGT